MIDQVLFSQWLQDNQNCSFLGLVSLSVIHPCSWDVSKDPVPKTPSVSNVGSITWKPVALWSTPQQIQRKRRLVLLLMPTVWDISWGDGNRCSFTPDREPMTDQTINGLCPSWWPNEHIGVTYRSMGGWLKGNCTIEKCSWASGKLQSLPETTFFGCCSCKVRKWPCKSCEFQLSWTWVIEFLRLMSFPPPSQRKCLN